MTTATVNITTNGHGKNPTLITNHLRAALLNIPTEAPVDGFRNLEEVNIDREGRRIDAWYPLDAAGDAHGVTKHMRISVNYLASHKLLAATCQIVEKDGVFIRQAITFRDDSPLRSFPIKAEYMGRYAPKRIALFAAEVFNAVAAGEDTVTNGAMRMAVEAFLGE